MTAPFAPPIGVDLLTQAADYVRPLLDRSNLIGDRVRALWAAVVTARGLAASDVVEGEFLQLARDTGLVADLGSPGSVEDLAWESAAPPPTPPRHRRAHTCVRSCL
jgi:hypothetical protein